MEQGAILCRLIIPKELPAYEALSQENVFVMHREVPEPEYPPAAHPDSQPDAHQDRDRDPARPLLANSPLQVQITLLQTATHDPAHTSPEHMKAFYKTFDKVRHERYDGMIITGAPLEDLDYDQVDYWDELCEIMEYTKENVYSTIHLCWGALAGLYYHFGIPKVHLPQKMFGVFEHHVTRPSNPLVRGFDEVFLRPPQPLGRGGPGRHRRLPRPAHPGGERRGRADAAFHRIRAADLCHRHPEYDKYTLDTEYKRDVAAGKPIASPATTTRTTIRPRPAVPLARPRVSPVHQLAQLLCLSGHPLRPEPAQSPEEMRSRHGQDQRLHRGVL